MVSLKFSAALLLAGAAALMGCSEPKTTDQLLLGEWEMTSDVVTTTGGETVSMREGEIEYKTDGTTEGEIIVQRGDMAFKIESTGTYILDGMTLTEKTTDAQVTVISGGAAAEQLRDLIRQGAIAAPAASTTITSVTRDKLTLTEPTTSTVMVFERD